MWQCVSGGGRPIRKVASWSGEMVWSGMGDQQEKWAGARSSSPLNAMLALLGICKA